MEKLNVFSGSSRAPMRVCTYLAKVRRFARGRGLSVDSEGDYVEKKKKIERKQKKLLLFRTDDGGSRTEGVRKRRKRVEVTATVASLFSSSICNQ